MTKELPGIYRGLVVRNADPEGRGRVTLLVDALGTVETNWAWPCVPISASGAIVVPDSNTVVWVMFIAGDPNHPVWMGTWI